MTQSFDFSLTDEDIELTRRFMIELSMHAREYWSSDDFREFHLDVNFTDPQHMVGTYFAKLKVNGVAVPYGEVPSVIQSNNKRKVDLWKWDWVRWRNILKSRLL